MTYWLTPPQRERLRIRLQEIPDLMALVETQHATLMPRRPSIGGRPTPGSRSPIDLAVVDLLDSRGKRPARDERNPWLQANHADPLDHPARVHNEALDPDEWVRLAIELDDPRRTGVLPTLESWVRLADSEMCDDDHEHIPPADHPTMTTEAGWLTLHLDWIAQQQWSDEFEQGIRRIHHDLQAIVGEGRPEYRPRCPKCQGRMADEGSYFTCGDCGESVRTEALDHRSALATDQPMTAYDFRHFGVSPEVIRKWVERGLLSPAVTTAGEVMKRGKRHCYHTLDVLRLADTSGIRTGS